MSRPRRAVLPALLLALLPFAPADAVPPRSGDPVLLALGDSVAAGVGAEPGRTGYPELVADELSDGYNSAADKATPNAETDLDVVNLAVPGATTGSLGPQLDRAVALIRERRADRDPKNDVEVVTLTIGGNDVVRPVLGACLPTPDGAPRDGCQAVTSAQLAQVAGGVEVALRRLTAAAGKRAEVVVTTYYNALLAPCPLVPAPVARLAERLAEVVLLGDRSFGGVLTVEDGLNDVIARAAARTGAQVADVHGDVGVDELVGDCLHPNAEGHEEIAERVVATLER